MGVQSLRPPAVIAVLGAGNMGSGIAQAAAQAGYTVRVRDVTEPMLERGRSLVAKTLEGGIQRKKITAAQRDQIAARITWTTRLREAVDGASLIVEAVFEEEKVKRALFQEIAPLALPEAIVATNTSSLSVTKLGRGFPSPARFAGLHFFYPAAVNRLLEIIGGRSTSPETLERLEEFGYRLRKIPIRVQDQAGFAVNRYFVPYLNEAARMAGEATASLASIEKVGEELFGASLGPFELMNATGVPIAYHSMRSLERAFGPAYAPAPLLKARFKSADKWEWRSTERTPEKEPKVRDRYLGLVFGITTRLVEEGVATSEAVDRGATVGLRWSKGPFALLSETGLPEALALVRGYSRRAPGSFPVSRELAARARKGERTWPMRYVRVERRGPIAWVLLDRPETLNALNSTMLAQIGQAFEELDKDPTVRCAVLSGSSPVFAAGADILEMERKDLAEGRAFGFLGQSVLRRIEEFHAPVIALVEGFALGGGLELALAADFIVASESAKLGLPEATVGIHPGFGGASRLTRLIGRGRTKLLIFTAAPVPAAEAARLGVVARVFPDDAARSETEALATTIAARAPLALSWVKSVINRSADSSLEASLRLEGESAGHTFATADRSEGMAAFRERRTPKFQGR